MKNPRILLECVPLVRRLLVASELPEVARVGLLGEITYLVDERIEQAEIDIYDSLIASCAKDGRTFAARRMQKHRDALQRFVDKNLLKTGITCGSRQYEVYVDAKTETLVHLSGFELDPPPDEPHHASLADRARWIFAHPRDSRNDGERVVQLLLDGRDVSTLSSEELVLLAKGYNWWGQNAKAFEVAKLGLTREPHNGEWLSSARLYVWNSYLQSLPRYLTACDSCIAAGIGPPAFWHLLKADHYIGVATGEFEWEDYEWSPGHPIPHPELLRTAAEAMEAALACDPRLREKEDTREWVGDWNARFAAVLQDPACRHLTQ